MSLDTAPFTLAQAISPWMLWAAFAAAALAFGILSWVLHFHWREYGMGRAEVRKAEAMYFIGAFGMLGAAFASLLAN